MILIFSEYNIKKNDTAKCETNNLIVLKQKQNICFVAKQKKTITHTPITPVLSLPVTHACTDERHLITFPGSKINHLMGCRKFALTIAVSEVKDATVKTNLAQALFAARYFLHRV